MLLTGAEIATLGIVGAGAEIEQQQVQPNGIDLRLDELWTLEGRGALGRDDADRVLPTRHPLSFGPGDWVELPAGHYGFRFADVVRLPVDCGALVFPRSSLLRMGVSLPTAVWDAGYHGRAEGLLYVSHPHGVRLQRHARIAQLVVFRLSEPTKGYAGRYQNEGV